jgi:SAM-dependent methyltransferase
MKRASRSARIQGYYDEFAPDYVATWKSIQFYEKPVRDFLREVVRGGVSVLDAGCGPGHLTRGLPPSVEVVGFDIAEAMLELARKGRPAGAYHRHDYHDPLPRAWGRFEVVLALGTFEFCDDLELVLRNLAAAMQPGGRMFMSVVERRPGVRLHKGKRRPLSEAELSGVNMFLYTFAEQVGAIMGAGLLPRSYRHHPGWHHTEYDVDVLYALWDLEAPHER